MKSSLWNAITYPFIENRMQLSTYSDKVNFFQCGNHFLLHKNSTPGNPRYESFSEIKPFQSQNRTVLNAKNPQTKWRIDQTILAFFRFSIDPVKSFLLQWRGQANKIKTNPGKLNLRSWTGIFKLSKEIKCNSESVHHHHRMFRVWSIFHVLWPVWV